MTNWTARYIPVPFVDGGRSFDGADCWGLVRLIYANELGIDLPSYGEISAQDLIRVSRNIDAGKDGEEWANVDRKDIKPFDVCVMRLHGTKRIGHVGVVVNTNSIIHVEKDTETAIVSLSHFTIKERIGCFRRHKATKKF